MDYIRLTKIRQSDADCSLATCSFLNTAKCSIHNGGHCENCNVFAQIVAKLCTFENAWDEMMRVGGGAI